MQNTKITKAITYNISDILELITNINPSVIFEPSDSFYWSPKNNKVYYINEDSEQNIWSLLHESAHASLEHKSYKSDFELLTMEMKAWQHAKITAINLGIEINEDHIQDCLDTYRDWLHQRSTCPGCSNVCFQSSSNEYRCHNCYTSWQVSNSRFCRPYRSVNKVMSVNTSTKQNTYFE